MLVRPFDTNFNIIFFSKHKLRSFKTLLRDNKINHENEKQSSAVQIPIITKITNYLPPLEDDKPIYFPVHLISAEIKTISQLQSYLLEITPQPQLMAQSFFFRL